MEEEQKIRVGITQGDVNGVGLEVVLKTLSDTEFYDLCTPIIYGSPKAVAYHRKLLNLPNFSLNNIRTPSEAHPRRANIVACGDDEIHVEPGRSSTAAGQAAFVALETAVTDLKAGLIDVLVTAPINKNNIQSDAFHFPGHTEYLAEQAGEGRPLMLLVADKLRVGVVAGHVPIAQVATYITTDLIVDKLRTLNTSLKHDFMIRRPRIAVLGLNPHSGDGGLLGDEEQTIIQPAIDQANEEGMYVFGPLAADGLFGSDALYKYDAVLAMYHDQGLAPFKAIAFESGVNYTAGLPFVRTSPDHGTAYDIAGTGQADPASMRSAICLAIDIYRNRQLNTEIARDPLQPQSEKETEKNA